MNATASRLFSILAWRERRHIGTAIPTNIRLDHGGPFRAREQSKSLHGRAENRAEGQVTVDDVLAEQPPAVLEHPAGKTWIDCDRARCPGGDEPKSDLGVERRQPLRGVGGECRDYGDIMSGFRRLVRQIDDDSLGAALGKRRDDMDDF